MPIFWLTRFMPCGGRSVTGTSFAVVVDGDGRLMAVLNRPDDVLRSPGGVAAEEDAGRVDCIVVSSTTGMSHLSNSMPRSRSIQGNAFSCPIARITSSQGRMTVSIVRRLAWRPRPTRARSNSMPVELAVLDHEALGRVVDDDLDAFFFGVLQLPGRRFEEAARPARHHFDVFAAQPARGAAAIHGRIADADDQNPFADRVDVAEGDGFQPVDADVDAVRIVAAGDIEILAARRAAADEDRVETLVQQRLHAVDRRVVADLDAHVEDVVDLFRQALFPAGGRRECWCASGRPACRASRR